MRIHAARGLDSHAWADASQARTAGRVQFRIGVTRYSGLPGEIREFAAELLAAAESVEHAAAEPDDGGQP